MNGDEHTPCAVCGTTFAQALDRHAAGDWTFHWGGPEMTTVVAETCSQHCADRFEAENPR